MDQPTDELIASLENKITNAFIELFEESDQELNITKWSDRFKLIGTNVEDPTNDLEAWTITFEDMQSPYAHFNLHMNGDEPDGFSIDT